MPSLIVTKNSFYNCENNEVIAAVTDALHAKGLETSKPISIEEILLDFGGCLIAGTIPTSVPGTCVSFFPHHYSLLRVQVDRCQAQSGGYYLLRGSRYACLSESTFDKLKAYLTENETELIQHEAAGTETLTEGIARIGKHPNVQL